MRQPCRIFAAAVAAALLHAAPLLAQDTLSRNGGYASWWKLLILIPFVWLWCHATDWVSRDTQVLGDDIDMPQQVWNPIMVFTFLVLFLVALLIPLYPVTVALVVLAYAVPVGTYVVMRNQRVTENQKVLTPAHIKLWLSNLGRRDKLVMESVLPHEMGAPVVFQELGENGQTQLINARQSEFFVDLKELMADLIDRHADRAMLDYTADAVNVRMDIDGVWHPLDPRERDSGDGLLECYKMLCGLNPADRRSRQQGEFKFKYDGGKYGGQLTSQGTPTGERVVVSIDYGDRFNTLEELGMRPKLRELYTSYLRGPKGIVLISAMPSGGLSTLWNVSLKATDRLMRDFVSISDVAKPEPEVENVVVETYDLQAGQTPDKMLPGILLKQPEVLVVPEPPNAETVRILCNEVLQEERLVLSSVRAKESVEALLRILLLKTPPAEFANSVTCVINTRLIRKLCETCKQGYEPPPQLLQRLGIPPGRVEALYREWQPPPPDQQPSKKEPEVCPDCGGIGYRGRTGLFEVLVVDDMIRQLLAKQQKLELLRKAARQAGARSLQEEGILLVAKGVTSLNELQRVLKA